MQRTIRGQALGCFTGVIKDHATYACIHLVLGEEVYDVEGIRARSLHAVDRQDDVSLLYTKLRRWAHGSWRRGHSKLHHARQ